jgi:hypothetical protein
MINDASKEKDESHAGKVVERHWYDKNKHIFPASRWEVSRQQQTALSSPCFRTRQCRSFTGVSARVRFVCCSFRSADPLSLLARVSRCLTPRRTMGPIRFMETPSSRVLVCVSRAKPLLTTVACVSWTGRTGRGLGLAHSLTAFELPGVTGGRCRCSSRAYLRCASRHPHHEESKTRQ